MLVVDVQVAVTHRLDPPALAVAEARAQVSILKGAESNERTWRSGHPGRSREIFYRNSDGSTSRVRLIEFE
jgi:hypothetical protein